VTVEQNQFSRTTANASAGRNPEGQRVGHTSSPGSDTEALPRCIEVALLTGGGDKPYAMGLGAALAAKDIRLDFIGSDDVNGDELRDPSHVNFLNLRGDQRTDVSSIEKALRILRYYVRLIKYAATARPRIFHLLWNNKFEVFDRTVLMLYYRLLGKRIVFTAHNVNAGKRDSNDSVINRLSLRVQYWLSHHIFVHTEMMKKELLDDFGVKPGKASVIPFGINETLPSTDLTPAQAKAQLPVQSSEKTMIFFGNIAPYKGLHYLIEALAQLPKDDSGYRLIVAGRPKGCEDYWAQIQMTIDRCNVRDRIIQRIEYIPDEKVEVYLKAADVLLLPYTHIFQSGVLFLAYGFGLPVIVSDVGSMREDVVEGRTGFVCRPKDPVDLARQIQNFFSSDLYRNLQERRADIKTYASERYSWTKVGDIARGVYTSLLPRVTDGHPG
jgi:D-inositol-3-phosphate glycosyltransferase